MHKTIIATSVLALMLGANLYAQAPRPQAPGQDTQASQSSSADQSVATDPRLAQARQVLASLNYRQGDVALAGADAHFRLGPEFRYLDKGDADKVLEHVWRNPHADAVLGMVVPAAIPLTDDHAWAVVVTRKDDGHVADADAAKTDYAELLKTMQQATLEENAERKKEGYPEMTLVGWALPPRYDAASKKLYLSLIHI